jgi:undecaprenyl phosphate-alpha-L-ara4N flippase subunit ArnE
MNLDFRLGTWIGLISTPFMIAGGQVLFKLTSRDVGDFNVGGVYRMLLNPYLLSALALYGLGTVVWIHVLKIVPLTIAYSFMALTFCIVPVLAHFLLNEPITWKYGFGALLIMGGMLIINTQR